MKYLNFSWVLEGSLAGAQGPTSHRDLVFLKLRDIRAIIRMDENTISGESVDLIELYEPMPDFTAPNLEQIERMTRFIEDQIETWERPVVVTCAAGMGRTGTVLACYLVYVGHQPQEAINLVRKLRPGSIQTRDQEETVFQYGDVVKSRLQRRRRRG